MARKTVEQAKTIRMQREGKFADVHPDEVANWLKCGWEIVKTDG